MAAINTDRMHRDREGRLVYIVNVADHPDTGEQVVVYRFSGSPIIEYFWRNAGEFLEVFEEA